MKDPITSTAHSAWLKFIDTCQIAVGRSQLERGRNPESVVPSLFDAAGHLGTHAERMLGAAVVSQIAGRLVDGAVETVAGQPAVTSDASVLAKVLGTIAQREIPQSQDHRVNTVLAYVKARYLASDCRLVEIARQLRMSRTHLSRLVLRETGFTFKHHVQLARMQSAARLLTTTEMSIKEVASAVGYEHVPSFDRKFRRYFQLTPGRFRRLRTRVPAVHPPFTTEPTPPATGSES